MARASFVSPVYLYASLRTGSGKASLIANQAVYLSNSGFRVAIIDLNTLAPDKLKAVFPPNTDLQIYEDLAHILNARDSRYQRTFYFTDTQKISYFPGKSLPSPQNLFQDTSLRDFFLQTRATFDVVIINFPSGDTFCLSASELLEHKHLWHGSQPVLIVLSTSERNSLLKLDGIMRKSPALSFQLRENALVVFNKVPGSLQEQRLADTSLTVEEIRKVFKSGNQFFVSNSEEIPHQKNIAAPIVLKTDSLLNQCMTRFNRLLKQAAAGQTISGTNEESEYYPTLDGAFLEKLSPYLARIKAAAASRLFVDPAELMVFLEEANNSYRIRIRVTGQKQKTLGIPEQIQKFSQEKRSERNTPKTMDYPKSRKLKGKLAILQRHKTGTLSVKPVYRFNDNFSQKTSFNLNTQMHFIPAKCRYPSPILLRHEHVFAGIPTLSQILGFSRKAYTKLLFKAKSNQNKHPEVTHFFLPPEFDLWHQNHCLKVDQIFLTLNKERRINLEHELYYTPAYEFDQLQLHIFDSIPDLFSRNQAQQILPFHCAEFPTNHSFIEKNAAKLHSFSATSLTIQAIEAVADHFELKPAKTTPLPKILPLIENNSTIDSKDLFACHQQYFIADNQKFSCNNSFVPDTFIQLNPGLELDLKLLKLAFVSNLSLNLNDEKITLTYITKLPLSKTAVLNSFSNDKPEYEVQFINPPTKELPQNFKIETSLLEQQLQVDFSEVKYVKGSIDVTKACPQTNITFTTFFPGKFPDNLKDKPPNKLPELKKKQIKQKITPPQQDFKRIHFKKLTRPSTQKWDILQVILLNHKDSSYNKLSGDVAYRTDYQCEQNLRKLTPLKSGMLCLKKHKQTETVYQSCALTNKLLKLKHSLPTTISPELADRGLNESLLYRIDLKSFELGHHFPANKEIGSSAIYNSERFIEPTIRDVFSKTIAEPLLFTLPFHSLKSPLYSSQQTNTITSIKDATLSLVDFPDTLQVNQQIYEYSLVHNEITIPGHLPPRQKTYEAPELPDNFAKKLLTINLSEAKLQMSEAEIPDCFIQAQINKVDNLQNKKGILFRPYPLFKPLLNLEQPKSLAADEFFIAKPEPLDELYKNLLWNLQQQLSSSFAHRILPMTIKPTELKIKQHRIELKYGENTRFVRRILSGPSRIYLPLNRNEFSIINPKLKDLLVLARLAGTKFKQVGSYAKS